MKSIERLENKMQYKLKAINNLIKVSGYFDRNLIISQDFVILHLNIRPLINFNRSVKSISLNFSDKSLNRTIQINESSEVIFNPSEEYKYSTLIYITSDVNSPVYLTSVSIPIDLPR